MQDKQELAQFLRFSAGMYKQSFSALQNCFREQILIVCKFVFDDFMKFIIMNITIFVIRSMPYSKFQNTNEG